jgi:hypothetical protein
LLRQPPLELTRFHILIINIFVYARKHFMRGSPMEVACYQEKNIQEECFRGTAIGKPL